MSNVPLNVGVVGVGAFGRNHARVYAEMEGVHLLGVVDADFARAQEISAKHNCRAFKNVAELIASGVQAVSITTPTVHHAAAALECLHAGVHTLVEKPIASKLSDAKKIITAAHAKKLTLMVGHLERFNPAITALKKALVGERLISISITRVGPLPLRITDVGIITDLGVHDIDLIRFIAGEEIVEGHALTSTNLGAHEDVGLMQFKTESGVLGQINTNWITPFKNRSLQVATEGKFFECDLITRQVVEYSNLDVKTGAYTTRHLNVPNVEPLKEELSHFITCVKNGQKPLIDGEDGAKVLSIALRILRATKYPHPATLADGEAEERV